MPRVAVFSSMGGSLGRLPPRWGHSGSGLKWQPALMAPRPSSQASGKAVFAAWAEGSRQGAGDEGHRDQRREMLRGRSGSSWEVRWEELHLQGKPHRAELSPAALLLFITGHQFCAWHKAGCVSVGSRA